METPNKKLAISVRNGSVDALRQFNELSESRSCELDLMSLQEVADLLRIARITVYRLVAKRMLPVYRICRRMRFKRKDILDYLERGRLDADAKRYGPTD